MDFYVTEHGTHLTCAWYALCDRPAEWVTRGPVGDGAFDMVPICQRCADKLGITDLVEYGLV